MAFVLANGAKRIGVSKKVLHEHCMQVSNQGCREALQWHGVDEKFDGRFVVQQHDGVGIAAGGPALEQVSAQYLLTNEQIPQF